jgi:hypothetical protein
MLSQRLTMVFIGQSGESGESGVELTIVQLWLVTTRRKCRKHPTSAGDIKNTRTCSKTTNFLRIKMNPLLWPRMAAQGPSYNGDQHGRTKRSWS